MQQTNEPEKTPEKASKPAAAGGGDKAAKGGPSEDALLAALSSDHQHLTAVMAKYADPGKTPDIRIALRELCDAWLPHALVEEEIVYPAIRAQGAPPLPYREALVLHDLAKVMLWSLAGSAADDEWKQAQWATLIRLLGDIAKIEEAVGTSILAKLKQAETVEGELAQRVKARKAELSGQIEQHTREMLAFHTLNVSLPSKTSLYSLEAQSMNRQSNMRDRDEDGRFTSSDDRRGGRSAGSDRDYDNRRSSSDSRPGWQGDPEGHAEAARLGWERRGAYDDDQRSSRGRSDDDRSYGRGRSDYDDDRRYGRGRSDDDNGRYGSQASRSSGYDDDRRSSRHPDDQPRDQMGRFTGNDDYGSSRGGRYDDDRRSSYGSGRQDYDDDRRRSSGRNQDDDDGRSGRSSGHGGWFGDSRGHADAARRGWDNRRD